MNSRYLTTICELVVTHRRASSSKRGKGQGIDMVVSDGSVEKRIEKRNDRTLYATHLHRSMNCVVHISVMLR